MMKLSVRSQNINTGGLGHSYERCVNVSCFKTTS